MVAAGWVSRPLLTAAAGIQVEGGAQLYQTLKVAGMENDPVQQLLKNAAYVLSSLGAVIVIL